MKLDDANLDPSRPLDCKEPDLAASKFDMIKSIQWATWEACARAYGHKNEIVMRTLFETWLERDEAA